VILFELTGSENHPAYQALEVSNGKRQYDFLQSMVVASLQMRRPFLSHNIIKALNFQAIACLHTSAGEYRPCAVTIGNYNPPEHYRVQALMDDFVDFLNRWWETSDPVVLASFTLWRMNYIHPFINGNGRTARASCYFVLCIKLGGWLPGSPILPELIREHREEYIAALKSADQMFPSVGVPTALTQLHGLLSRLLGQQLSGASPVNPSVSPVLSPPSP
jgi:fido (protein-threonine AMPylation protein)